MNEKTQKWNLDHPQKKNHELRLSWKSSAVTLVKSSTIAGGKKAPSIKIYVRRSRWMFSVSRIPVTPFRNVFCNISVSPTQNKSKIVHVMKFVDLFSSAQDASFICWHQGILDMMIHVNIVICSVQRTAHDAEVVTTAWRILRLRQEETDYAYGSQLRIYVLNHQLHRAKMGRSPNLEGGWGTSISSPQWTQFKIKVKLPYIFTTERR